MARWCFTAFVAGFWAAVLLWASTVQQGGIAPECVAVPISIDGDKTAVVIAGVPDASILVCSLLEEANKTGTAQWSYGTRASSPCDTAAVAVTGPMHVEPGESHFAGGAAANLFRLPAGKDFCVSTSSLGPAGRLAGYVSYRYQN